MKRYIILLMVGALLFLATPPTTGRAMLIGNGCTETSGKLISMTRLKERYKLVVGAKTLFIIADGSKNSHELVRRARPLVDKQVTVVYIETDRRVVSIFPARQDKEK